MESARIVLIGFSIFNLRDDQVLDTLVLPVISSLDNEPSQFKVGLPLLFLTSVGANQSTNLIRQQLLIGGVIPQDGLTNTSHLFCHSYDCFVFTMLFDYSVQPHAQTVFLFGCLDHNRTGSMDE